MYAMKIKDANVDGIMRQAEAESAFLRTSGRYPLCGVGDVNTYSVFAEHFRGLISQRGRFGIIVPTGIVTVGLQQASEARRNRTCPGCGLGQHDTDARHCKRCGEELPAPATERQEFTTPGG